MPGLLEIEFTVSFALNLDFSSLKLPVCGAKELIARKGSNLAWSFQS
jgi:hypothetical protein